MDVISYARNNPVTATAIVAVLAVGGLMLFMPSKSGGRDGGGIYDPNMDPSVIAARMASSDMQYQIQAEATSRINQANAEIRLAEIMGANQLAIERLRFDTQGDITDAELAAQIAMLKATNDARTAELASMSTLEVKRLETELEGTRLLTSATLQRDLADIAAQRDAAGWMNITSQTLAGLNAQTQQVTSALSAQTSQYIVGATTQMQTEISRQQAAVAIAQTQAAERIAKAQGAFGLGGMVLGRLLG